MRRVDNIFIHCTAGFGNVDSLRRFWRSMGWKVDGYHFVILTDGTVEPLVPISQPSNGVRGYNQNSIHIAYQGGVSRSNVNRAEDTRTEAQKASLVTVIQEVLKELKKHQAVDHVRIAGHRDASPDANGSGVIESWERIKECPSFDVVPYYGWMMGKKALQSKRLVWKPGEHS
jgi:N-acetylmuramoyl-L-alanine amidase